MKALQTAIVFAAIGVVVCLWLLTGVRWYNFLAFMLVAQPLLLLAVIVFVVATLREVKRKGLL